MEALKIISVTPNDRALNQQIDQLLYQSNIRRDGNLEYTCALVNENFDVIGTGSYFSSTLRCLAIDCAYKGRGLLNEIVTHLFNKLFDIGRTHLFIYTKFENALFFENIGFTRIVDLKNEFVFMENQSHAFSDYLKELERKTDSKAVYQAGIVMNANPFTLGHQYLVEKASKENDWVHLFVLTEDTSLFPFQVRWNLVKEGTAHLSNVIMHPTSMYLISSVTFPSYFQHDELDVIRSQALLDVQIFAKIADTLSITKRYVGEEPYSQVTQIYNELMTEALSNFEIDLEVVERKRLGDHVISASTVRNAIKEDNWEIVKYSVPKSTYIFLESKDSLAIRKAIKDSRNVIHY